MGHARLTDDSSKVHYPEYLNQLTKNHINTQSFSAVVMVRMQEKDAVANLKQLVNSNPNADLIDNYDEQYAELLLSRNAHLYRANHDVQVASVKKMIDEHYNGKKPWQLGTWVYFPWKNQLVHVLEQNDFEELRTIRNRELITAEEQSKLLDFSVASFGMSVGSAGALALAISGISRKIKLIDGAVISGSNLNRILTGVTSVGLSKATVIGRQIYEMNPYSSVAYYEKANKENIQNIISSGWSTNLIVDEIDDIESKVRIRHEARKRKIPVIMATELGDTVMLDVERFDQEPERPLFHGMLPGIEELLTHPIVDYREWTKHAVKIIDPRNMSIKMQKSLLKIGTTVVTHPQLGSTVMITGGVLAFAAKTIAINGALNSGRYVISLENMLLADHKTWQYKRKQREHTKILQSSVNGM